MSGYEFMRIDRLHICGVGPDEEALHEAFRQCGAMVQARGCSTMVRQQSWPKSLRFSLGRNRKNTINEKDKPESDEDRGSRGSRDPSTRSREKQERTD